MEWIKYHEAEKVFDLRTEHSTYQMQVREYDTLVHLYYGSPVGDALITDRIVCVDRGLSMVWKQSRQTAVILQI